MCLSLTRLEISGTSLPYTFLLVTECLFEASEQMKAQ